MRAFSPLRRWSLHSKRYGCLTAPSLTSTRLRSRTQTRAHTLARPPFRAKLKALDSQNRPGPCISKPVPSGILIPPPCVCLCVHARTNNARVYDNKRTRTQQARASRHRRPTNLATRPRACTPPPPRPLRTPPGAPPHPPSSRLLPLSPLTLSLSLSSRLPVLPPLCLPSHLLLTLLSALSSAPYPCPYMSRASNNCAQECAGDCGTVAIEGRPRRICGIGKLPHVITSPIIV